eukprot:5159335-Amphidinium_carterae.3
MLGRLIATPSSSSASVFPGQESVGGVTSQALADMLKTLVPSLHCNRARLNKQQHQQSRSRTE